MACRVLRFLPLSRSLRSVLFLSLSSLSLSSSPYETLDKREETMPKSTLSAPPLAVLSLLLLSLLASSALAQPPFLPPPGNPACIAAANNLATGACHAAATKLRATAASLKDATCEQLGASEAVRLVNAECCADVRSFVASGCGCDPGVLGLLGAAGVPAAALAGGVKLATVSLLGVSISVKRERKREKKKGEKGALTLSTFFLRRK